MDGVLVVDKPSGPTSFDVVRKLRHKLGVRKIGHGGTLDPMASGVLPVCLGEATKLAPFLLGADKEYEAALQLGIETDTLDAEGRVVARHVVGVLDASAIEDVLASFRGEIEQTPPMYSALKHEGRALHEIARAGETVERAPRRVTIHELVLLRWLPPAGLEFRVRCSKGTYVRSLAADIGRALAVGAHLTALRRIRSGPFDIADASTLQALLAAERPPPLVTLPEALRHLPRLTVDGGLVLPIEQGKKGPPHAAGFVVGMAFPAALLRPDGTLLAVAESAGENLRTLRVFR